MELPIKRIITPRQRGRNKADRQRNADLRTLKRLQKFYATREPNVPFDLDARELELTRQALGYYIAGLLVKDPEAR